MKVKELIAMLQECNPESHVRGYKGIITFVEGKEGYWDGPYEYISKDEQGDGGKWVISSENSKVDIHIMDGCDWVWDKMDEYDDIPDFYTFLDKHFEMKFTYNFPEQRMISFIADIREVYDHYVEYKSENP